MKQRFKPEKLPLKEQGYIIGFFIGDGNLFIKKKNGQYRVRFYLGKNEQKIAKHLNKLLQKTELNTRKYYSEKDSTIVVEIYSKELCESIIKMVKKDKTLLKLGHPKETLVGIVEGLIDSDGYVQRKYVEITTANEKLEKQITKILLKLGAKPKVRKSLSPLSNKEFSRVGFSLNDVHLCPVKGKRV